MPSQESHLNFRFKVKDRYGTGGGATSFRRARLKPDPPSLNDMLDKPRLRNKLRAQRRELSPYQQKLASQSLMRRAIASVAGLSYASNIALYLPVDGEISLIPLLQWCLSHSKQCYLPVLDQHDVNRLNFSRYQTGQQLVRNRFGIEEPATSRSQQFTYNDLDIIFMPTVGFDDSSRRLGMGGGFYDRTLAGCHDANSRRPLLVAVAHDIQYTSQLPEEPWDIHPDMTLTPSRVVIPHR